MQEILNEGSRIPTTLYGLIYTVFAMLISQIAMWFREWRKWKNFKERNGQLNNIEEKLAALDIKVTSIQGEVALIKRDVSGQKNMCLTVQQNMHKRINGVDEAVKENEKRLFTIVEKGRK